MMVDSGQTGRLEWGVVSYPLSGETDSGDLHVVKEHDNGILVGVVDGLGHGSEAAHAARTAVQVLSNSPNESVISLVRRCHEQLLQTRGVVMSLVSFDFRDETVTWIGVGNVEGVLVRADSTTSSGIIHVVQRGGVVGYQLPPLHASVLQISKGDTVILATDGIRPEFYDSLSIRESPARLAAEIGERFRRESDDSLVLVVRYDDPR